MTASTSPARAKRQRGFTLLETVLVIAIMGIVAAMVGVFIRKPIEAYVDQARRAELSDTADLALRRIGRELARALPNSVRVDPGGTMLEFLPVAASGRYRAAPAADGSGDFLDFDDPADATFDILGTPIDVAAGSQLVVYNLGLPGADAYSGESRRTLVTSGSALASLGYATGGAQFPFRSPGNRFQIVPGPVTYACLPGAGGTGQLRRYAGYAIQAAQPVDAAAAPLAALTGRNAALLADKVESCAFAFGVGPAARIGVVTLTSRSPPAASGSPSCTRCTSTIRHEGAHRAPAGDARLRARLGDLHPGRAGAARRDDGRPLDDPARRPGARPVRLARLLRGTRRHRVGRLRRAAQQRLRARVRRCRRSPARRRTSRSTSSARSAAPSTKAARRSGSTS